MRKEVIDLMELDQSRQDLLRIRESINEAGDSL